MHPIRIDRRLLAILGCAALLAGCASAGKRYEQGQALEQQGRAADAARRYIDALKKDPGLADARTRLQESGSRAIADALAEADADQAAGRAPDAADAISRADALRGDAAAVGVQLQAPPDYAQRRRTALDRAVEQAMAEAGGAMQRRDYASAVQWLDRAAERWQPAAEQLARIDRTRFDAQLNWAEDEMAAGRFRSAFEHAGRAGTLRGLDVERAVELQREALRRGTVRVAVFPVGALSRVDDQLRQRVIPELNDELVLGFWQRPPQWIDVVNPVEAQRLARNRAGPGGELQPYEAGRLGRDLGARVAVVMTLDSVRRGESDARTTRRAARTRAGADTAYTVRESQMETWARVTYRIIDTGSFRGVIDQGTVSARSGTRLRRATYAGDWRELQLSSGDREMFGAGGDPGYNHETVRELANGLSDRLGREIYDALLRRIE